MSTSAMDGRVESTTAVIAQLDELRPTTVNSSEKLSLLRVYFALKQEKLRKDYLQLDHFDITQLPFLDDLLQQ